MSTQLQTQAKTGSKSSDTASANNAAKRHFSSQRGFTAEVLRYPIQTKLKIGQPSDKYEQEADRVADQVMRMPEPGNSVSTGFAPLVQSSIAQRMGPECEDELRMQPCKECVKEIQRQPLEEEEEELIQAKRAGAVTPKVTPAINSGIQSLQGGGQPLSGSERSFFEPRFGIDFSNVRVHNNPHAASIASLVNARAFTFGRNVVFGSGEYSPDVSAGMQLLAHELTHVVQQKYSKQKQVNVVPEIQLLQDCNNSRITGWDDSLERVIEAHGNAVAFARAARRQIEMVRNEGRAEPCVQRGLSSHFSNPNNTQLGIIVTHYNNTVRRLEQGARNIYLCVVTGCERTLAFQRGHDRAKICPDFFNSTVSDLRRAGVLVEEAAHFAGVSGDHYIGMPGYPGRTPYNNGPSYGRFAQHIGGCFGLQRMTPHSPRTPVPSRRTVP